MSEQMQCWKCGTPVQELLLMPGLRVARLAECPQCHSDLHVCRACAFYDTRVARQCRETVAEEVQDKTRANFCDYFVPNPGAFLGQDHSPARTADAQLKALFGEAPEQAAEPQADDSALSELNKLFGGEDKKQ